MSAEAMYTPPPCLWPLAWCMRPPGEARGVYAPFWGPGWPWPGAAVVCRLLPRKDGAPTTDAAAN
eukprot:9396776-Pyramimonas_sp.AAC.1